MKAITDVLSDCLVTKLSAGLELLEQYDRGQYQPVQDVVSQLEIYAGNAPVDKATIFLSAEDLLLAHARVSDAPLLSRGMLESAAARPGHAAAYENISLTEAAMLLAEGIIRNHPFADGNKRSALLASCAFLAANDHMPGDNDKSLADIMIALAEGRLDARQAARLCPMAP